MKTKACMKISILCFLFSLWVNPVRSQTYFPPLAGNQWDTLSVDRFGYCQDRIDSLYNFLDENNSKGFILLREGKIVLEKYFDDFTQDSNWYWASAGKTLTAAVIGVLESKNALSITDKTSKYLGSGWTSLPQNKEDSITIWHQLTMTTGLDDSPTSADCTDPKCLTYKAPVGKRWAYHNAPYTLLDGVISSASGKTLNQLLFSEFTANTGMKVLYLKLGYNNVAFSTPRSFARFGLLLLNKGKWNSTQLIPLSYYNKMVVSSQEMNPSYGYLTWLNGKDHFMVPQSQFRFSGDCVTTGPSDLIMALGKDGQQIHISPSRNMVWIRMGEAPDTQSPLVSMDLGTKIWEQINALSCNAAALNFPDSDNQQLYPNPISPGQVLHGNGEFLMDASGRKFPLINNEIPIELTEGIYQVKTSKGYKKIAVLNP